MARIMVTLASLLVVVVSTASAFVSPTPKVFGLYTSTTTTLAASVEYDAAAASSLTALSLQLTKPIGMILEEVTEGQADGVFVSEVGDSGSAVKYQSEIVGTKLSTVEGADVTALDFDAVMACIVNAPETVTVEFLVVDTNEVEEVAAEFAEGTAVAITVQQDGDKPDLVVNAKVGDNLRQALLDSGIEVYQGLKQKLGNCGGAGQCAFCAVDFVDSKGWLERSDYEDGKLGKNPDARLACLNNIQGPATIRKAKR